MGGFSVVDSPGEPVPTRLTAAPMRRRPTVFFVLLALLGVLAGCGTSTEATTTGVSMPPNALRFVLTGSTPLNWGWLFVGVAGIDGDKAVLLEMGVGPDAVSNTQRYAVHRGDHVSLNGWDVQVADIEPGPRDVILYVITGPGAPQMTSSAPASTAR